MTLLSLIIIVLEFEDAAWQHVMYEYVSGDALRPLLYLVLTFINGAVIQFFVDLRKAPQTGCGHV